MTTLFDICTNTNNWIYLENLSELEDQSILYVSKMMQMIQQEIILDEIKNVEGNYCELLSLKSERNEENEQGTCRKKEKRGTKIKER